MAQPLLPMFPSDVTEINPLMSFAKREGTVYYFNGPMPVFSHAESDRASFAMFASQMVVNGNCKQAEIVRAFGISAISVKRYVKRYRQSGTAGFFRVRKTRQPRVLTPVVRHKAQELIQQGMGRNAVAQELGLKSDTLRKAIKAGRIVEAIKKKVSRQRTEASAVCSTARPAWGWVVCGWRNGCWRPLAVWSKPPRVLKRDGM
jgi:predicted transcriptional regulator